jgi:transposase
VDQAKAFVPQQAVVHLDETGHKEAGRSGWMWVATTALVGVFIIRFSRAAAVAKELLGEGFQGRLVSDRWSAYEWVAAVYRQICWAHLERDFQKISERAGRSEQIGNAILAYVQQMWHLWHRFRSGQATRSWFQRKMVPIRRGIEGLLAEGTVCGHSKTQETCKRILKLKKALWTFVRQPGVEPTNNLAERILRSYVIWRKLSFGTQSERGRLFVERMMTVSATCKLQRRNLFDYVNEAVTAHLNGRTPPSLLPAEQRLPQQQAVC